MSGKNGKKPATFDHLRKKRPLEKDVPVCLDPGLLAQADEAQLKWITAIQENKPQDEVDRLKAEFDSVMEAIDDNTVVMKFRSPGRKKYEDLLLEHPPTEEQQEQYKAMYGPEARAPYDSDTFGPALVALCCAEPKMTVEQVAILFDGEYDDEGSEVSPPWNGNEILTLFTTAMAVCNSSRVGEMGKDSGATLASTRS